MYVDQVYLIICILFFTSFLVSFILHIKRLKSIIKIRSAAELKKNKYVTQPYLLVGFVLSLLSIIFLTLALAKPLMPYSLTVPEGFFYFREISYSTEAGLILDMLLPVVVAVFSSLYCITQNQRDLGSQFGLWSGFILGCWYSFTVLIPLYFPLFLFLLIAYFFSLYAFEQLGAGGKDATMYIGLPLGFISMIVFLGLRAYLNMAINTEPCLFIFWLSLLLGAGIIVGSFYLFGPSFFIFPLLPLILAFILFFKVNFLAFLLGIVASILFIVEIKWIYKAIFVIVAVISIPYLIISEYPSLLFCVIFIVGLALSWFFVAEAYKSAVRAVLSRWILISTSSEGTNDEINFSEHESIFSFRKDKMYLDSYRFKWLNFLILKYLEKKGFSVNVVKEEYRRKAMYVKEILVGWPRQDH